MEVKTKMKEILKTPGNIFEAARWITNPKTQQNPSQPDKEQIKADKPKEDNEKP
jgi:hypothetical protein